MGLGGAGRVFYHRQVLEVIANCCETVEETRRALRQRARPDACTYVDASAEQAACDARSGRARSETAPFRLYEKAEYIANVLGRGPPLNWLDTHSGLLLVGAAER